MASKAKGRPLTAAFVRTVTRPGSYGDGRGGHGLTLLVRERSNGRVAKYWTQRVRLPSGRRTHLGLGTYPVVTLAEARKAALANVREIRAGRDPRGGGIPTFGDAVERLIAIRRGGWTDRTERMWRATFTNHAGPIMGRRIDRITTADLLAIVGPLWTTKPAVARAVRQRSSAVFRLAVAEGWRPDDPAGPPLVAALPKTNGNGGHFAALPAAQVGDALRRVRAATEPSIGLLATFIALTAVRTGEARGARWSEIDLDGATWTVPADRMKAGREHVVPLSTAALDVLRAAESIRDGSGYVFARRGRPVGISTVSRLFRTHDAGTVHGLRSSFRDWAGETGVAREVAEACLAHRVGNATEQAYARSDLLARRRHVMEAWGEYITR